MVFAKWIAKVITRRLPAPLGLGVLPPRPAPASAADSWYLFVLVTKSHFKGFKRTTKKLKYLPTRVWKFISLTNPYDRNKMYMPFHCWAFYLPPPQTPQPQVESNDNDANICSRYKRDHGYVQNSRQSRACFRPDLFISSYRHHPSEAVRCVRQRW